MRFLSNLIASTLGALLAFGIIVFILFLFIFMFAISADQTPGVQSSSVLVVEFTGSIPEIAEEDPLSQIFFSRASFDLLDFQNALEKAAADDRIAAVWLQLKNLNASWATLEEVRRSIEDFKQSGKPVYASSDDYYMDESAYFVLSAADSVFAAPQALFEFNGFFLGTLFFSDMLDRLNVEPQIVRAGEFKSAVEPFLRSDYSPENEEQLTALLEDWNNIFLDQVAQNRKMDPRDLERIALEDAIFSAKDAYNAGLLDDLLYKDQIEDLLKTRVGLDEDEDLPQINLKTYNRIPRSAAGLEEGNEGEIAIVYAVGNMMSGESGVDPNPLFGGQNLGAETFRKAMREARESDRVKAIVVRINSPGGSAPAADAMRRELVLAAEQKPVIVSMGDYAASGGYMLAAPADTIVASPTTLTGSIGVFSIFFDASGFLENKLGITHDVVQTGPYADMLSALRPLSAQEEAILARSTEQIYQSFIQIVAEGRQLNPARIDSIGQGRIWTGKQAHEIGLVDELGGLQHAIDLAAESAGLEEGTYRMRILPRPKTFFEELTETLMVRAGKMLTSLRSSPVERLWTENAQTLKQLVNDHGSVQARMPFQLCVQ